MYLVLSCIIIIKHIDILEGQHANYIIAKVNEKQFTQV